MVRVPMLEQITVTQAKMPWALCAYLEPGGAREGPLDHSDIVLLLYEGVGFCKELLSRQRKKKSFRRKFSTILIAIKMWDS